MKTFFKEITFHDPDYRQYVASLPSCISGQPGQAPHHIKRPGFGGTSKCCDLFCIPLTTFEHTEFHTIGWQTWETKYNVDQLVLALRTIEQAQRDGVIEINVNRSKCYG